MSGIVEVRFISPSCALVSGQGARGLLKQNTGRTPVWATRDRAWVTQPHHARSLVELLEHPLTSGIDVVVVNAEPEQPARADVDQEPSLW